MLNTKMWEYIVYTNKFPALPFCGLHSKHNGSRGMSKHYHLRFVPKLVNGVCAICCIPYACVAGTSILDKPWISGIPSYKQARYKPVTKFTDWPVLGYFNYWNIIQLSQKSTPYDVFDEIHCVVLDGISDNMASLVESVKYGAIKKTYTTTNGFYVIMLKSKAYTLQYNTTIYGKISLLANWLLKNNIFVLCK